MSTLRCPRGARTPRRTAVAGFALLSAFALWSPAAAQHPLLSARQADLAARLLRQEDRREHDGALLQAAAQAGPELRRRAALAAGRIGDRRATPFLSALVADPDSAVAASAAFALGVLRDTSAVPALAAELAAPRLASRSSVAGEAALALSKMPTAAGKRAVESFLEQAPATGAGVRRGVGEALLAIWRFPRPMHTAAVSRWLASPDSALRWRAAYALGRRPDPASTRALLEHLGDSNPLVRSFAVRGLTAALLDSAGIGRAQGLAAVLRASHDPALAVRVNAVRALGTYDDPASRARLAELLAGDDAHLAITAAESLGRLGSKASAEAAALRAVAADSTRPIFLRTTALASLGQVDAAGAPEASVAFMSQPGWRPRAAGARILADGVLHPAIGRETALAEALRDSDGRVATAALEAALAAAGDSVARIRPLLLEGLEHPDFYARVNALGGLGQLADPSTAPLLMEAYAQAQRDSMDDAALAAVDALGALARKDPAVGRAFLARFPRSGDYLVRQHAAAAFGDSLTQRAWGPALPILTGRSLDDYRRLVRGGEAAPRPRVRLVTSRGNIDLELFADDAPLTVDNFVTLAARGFFNGQEWPRVVSNFVIQGGDPRGDTNGGPGYSIRDEIDRHPYLSGTLGMALSGPDTGGSQWFITHSPQPHLDGTYTVFGRVVRGMEVVNRVLPGDRIVRVERLR